MSIVVEIYHLQKYVELKGQKTMQIVSSGPLKAELCFKHKISDVSTIEQTISLSCIGDRLEFDNLVDWNESHQFLVMKQHNDLRHRINTWYRKLSFLGILSRIMLPMIFNMVLSEDPHTTMQPLIRLNSR